MSFDERIRTEVFIAGSGPVGSTFAREAAAHGRSVLMVDAGPQLSRRPGAHLKNAYLYQQNVDLFVNVVRGHLVQLSVPTTGPPLQSLDPVSFDLSRCSNPVRSNQNPDQDVQTNLPGAAATYAVGGMATHWTCATPRHHPELERAHIWDDQHWSALYERAERILHTSPTLFENSIRHSVVRDALRREYDELPAEYAVQSLPLAGRARADDPTLVSWTGADTILEDLSAPTAGTSALTLREQHICRRLVLDRDRTEVVRAEVVDLETSRTIAVEADHYVVACGAVLTPQLLFASGIRPEPLGRYLTEQPLAFCQVVLRQDLVESVDGDQGHSETVRRHRLSHPDDPLPFPTTDPAPNVWIPLSHGRPWHCQVNRDAFSYGDVAAHLDDRLIVDLRWFGLMEPRPDNRVAYSDSRPDTFGMPQPTFHYRLDTQERSRQHEMMRDMLRAASCLGGFLPGAEPKFMSPGLSLHITGTTRIGQDPGESVVNPDGQVWGIRNLFLGGNGLIPRATASNPTLTSVAMALHAADVMWA